VGFEGWELGADEGEPVRRELGEECAFRGDALYFGVSICVYIVIAAPGQSKVGGKG